MRPRDILSSIPIRLQQFFSRLVPRSRRCQKRQSELQQRQLIQSLQQEIEHLKLTMEARILERSEELRIKARQMALVEQAGQRLTSILDPQTLLEEAVCTLREDFGHFTVALYLLEDNHWRLHALSTGDETVQQQPGGAIYAQPRALEQLRRASRPLVQGNLEEQAHPLGLPHLGRGRSSMTASLIASDQVLGALDLQSPLSGHFDEDDALILHTLASRVASALERSRLYRQEQRARQRADAMAVLARVVTTSLELDRVLSLALDQLRRVLPYDATAILLLEDGRLRPAVSRGLSPQADQALGTLFGSTRRRELAQLLEKGEPLLTTLHGEAGEIILPEFSAQNSWMAVPLTSRGAVIGAVFLASREHKAYSEADLRTAEDFAGQVSTAIENARLYGQVRQERDRLETLYEIAQKLNADLEMEDLLLHILELGQVSVGGVAGSLILLDRSGQPTYSILSRPSPTEESLLRVVMEQGAAGWAFRERRGLLVRDTQDDPRWYLLADDPWAARSAIVVPLIGQGQVIGILTVVHPQVGHFGQDDLALLTSIAGQASTVVQRARLFATIREERARLEAVIEGTADAVVILDEEGKILHINRSVADLFGLEALAVTSRPAAEVLDLPAMRALLRLSEEAHSAQAEVPLPDGKTFYATLTSIPGVGAVIMMHDISYLKELDRMKSDFVATVSHDLRTPLGAVQGFTEMLSLAGPLNEDQHGFTTRIIHTVESMSGLVQDLLDLAKIEAGVEMDMAPCQMAAVIAEVVDHMVGPATMKQVTLQIDIPDDLPLVWGNGRRLGQVVGNLVDNAIKYTPVGGLVILRSRPKGDDLLVKVVDNGPGIPATDLPRVFEKFYRRREVEGQTPGTGLGLSIARSIVQAHGGRIWAESTEGEGSTFSFRIPCWRG